MRFPRAIQIQPIMQLQWTDTKTTSENFIIYFLETNKVQYGLTKILFFFLGFLHHGKDFQMGYINFNIFDNSTFFSTTEKTNENYNL